MAKKVLITGISGFAGSHLAEYLVNNRDYSVFGTYLSEQSLKNLEKIKNKINIKRVDLTDEKKVMVLIENIRPDFIFHLAALALTKDSLSKPKETIFNNITAQINVLEAVKDSGLSSRILIVSSADVYGKVSKEKQPINEDAPFAPANPYAVSKIAQDFLGLQYFITYSMKIIRARPFNHIGPRQATGFVVSDFAKKIARIERKIIPPVLTVGNISAKRDFTDVRDMVRAYALLVVKGTAGDVYNIGAGISYRIEYILKTLASFSKVKINIKKDSSLFRQDDIPDRVCDKSKLNSQIGWKPEIPIEKTLKDTLDYWRNIV